MTIPAAVGIDQADVDFGREVADSFKSADALLDTKSIPTVTPETAKRFTSKIEVANDGCWRWIACLNNYGYGQFWLDGKTYLAHRVSLAWRIGGIPAGLTAEHVCHSSDPGCPGGVDCLHRRCARPDHLIAEPIRANTLAGKTVAADNAARNRCPRNHPLSGINLRSSDLRRGWRACRICKVVYQRAYDPVRRAAGAPAVARAAGQRAIASLTGLETPTSIGLEPLRIHYETDLFPWRQCSFNLGEVG